MASSSASQGSSILRDLAVDVLNVAKSGKDAKTKVFQLEQFREILLHREKSIIDEFVGDVFDFTTEKSSIFRKFLLRFSTELFELNPNLTLPHLIDMYNFYLSESNDSVVASMCREISKLYAKLVLAIYNFPDQQESRRLWPLLRNITSKLSEYVASARSDSIKSFGLHLMESMMLFGIPATSTTSDPRLARKINDPRLRRAGGAAQADAASAAGAAATAGGAATGTTAETIAAHHPFIAKNIIQSEAEELFGKLCSWCGQQGPVEFPFSPRLMSVLGQTLAAVGIERPHLGLQAAKGIVTIMVTRQSSSPSVDMTIVEKEQLARAATRLQRAITVFGANDTEDTLTKLKTAVNSLALTDAAAAEAAAETTAGAIVGKKRDYAEYIDEEDHELVSEEHQSSVKNALDSLESNKRKMLARSLAQSDNNIFNGQSLGSSEGYALDARSVPPVGVAEVTELSAELVSLQNLSYTSATKLVSVDTATMSGETSLMPSMNFDGKEYADLAHFNLLRVMDNFLQVKEMKTKASWRACQELLLRSVLSLTVSSVQSQAAPFLVTLIHTFSSKVATQYQSTVPSAVLLPRAVWLFVSFAFQVSQPIFPRLNAVPVAAAAGADALQQEDEQRRLSLYLLGQFCVRFHAAIGLLEEELAAQTATDVSPGLLQDFRRIYDNMVLVVLSRFLQIPAFRPYVKEWVFQLPALPLSVLDLVIVVSQSGSKTLTAANHHMQSSHVHSQRYDALSLLGSLVFVTDAQMSQATLQYLLWQTLSDDFKVRHRIIDLIISEVYHQNAEVDAAIVRFVMQSLVYLLDASFVRRHFATAPAAVAAVAATASAPLATTDEEEKHVDDMDEDEYAAYLERQEAQTATDKRRRPFSLYEVVDAFDTSASSEDDPLETQETREASFGKVDVEEFARHFHVVEAEENGDDSRSWLKRPDPSKQKDNFTKAMHLLERLTCVEASLMVVMLEVYLLGSHSPLLAEVAAGSTATAVPAGNESEASVATLAPTGETEGEPAAESGSGGAGSAASKGEFRCHSDVCDTTRQRVTMCVGGGCVESWSIGMLIRAKLKVVLGDLLSRGGGHKDTSAAGSTGAVATTKLTAADLFGLLSTIRGRLVELGGDAQREERGMMLYALQCVMPQVDQAPKLELILRVLEYLQLTPQVTPTEAEESPESGAMDVDEAEAADSSAVGGDGSTEPAEVSTAEAKAAAAVSTPTPDAVAVTSTAMMESWFQTTLLSVDDDAFLYLSQVLTAFSAATILQALPRVVRVYTSPTCLLNSASLSPTGAASASVDQLGPLKQLMQRWIKPIPAPIAKAALLYHLLRVDVDAENIDRKAFLAVVDVCLANKGDFHVKVIKDCLEMVVHPVDLASMSDEARAAALVPPFAIMRMAILSAKNYPETIGSYVLSTLIPTFIARQVWVTAPKVWDGVVMAAKILAASASIHAEMTLRALLGMPVSQLLGVVKVAPNLIPGMKKVLLALSADDREQLLRAHYHYPTASTGAAAPPSAASGGSSKADKDKEKVYKDLMDGKLGGGAAGPAASAAATGGKK